MAFENPTVPLWKLLRKSRSKPGKGLLRGGERRQGGGRRRSPDTHYRKHGICRAPRAHNKGTKTHGKDFAPCVFRRGARQRAHDTILHGKLPLPCVSSDNARWTMFAVRHEETHGQKKSNWQRQGQTARYGLCRAPTKNAWQSLAFVVRHRLKRTAIPSLCRAP
jgi:hypothetical protein